MWQLLKILRYKLLEGLFAFTVKVPYKQSVKGSQVKPRFLAVFCAYENYIVCQRQGFSMCNEQFLHNGERLIFYFFLLPGLVPNRKYHLLKEVY